MTRYIAFLRAINVGGHVVQMQALREQFEALGLARVETFIASGNVIFDAARGDPVAIEQRIERRLRDALGYDVSTFLRTPDELGAIAAHPAFPGRGAGEPGYPLYIAFTREPVSADRERTLLGFRNETDDFHVRGREVYWACRTSLTKSTFSGARLERAIGMPATSRNVTTVRKLAAKYGAGTP